MAKVPKLECALMAVSVDVDLPPAELKTPHGEASLQRLLDGLTSRGVAATWCVPAGQRKWLSDRIKSVTANQRLAITLASNRPSPSRLAGYTVAVRSTVTRELTDILLKYGVNAICDLSPLGQASKLRTPHLLRYGLWNFPVSITAASRKDLGSKLVAGVRTSRTVQQANKAKAILHSCVRLSDEMGHNSGRRSRLDDLFQQVAKLRAVGKFDVVTLTELPSRLAPARAKLCGQSILRAA